MAAAWALGLLTMLAPVAASVIQDPSEIAVGIHYEAYPGVEVDA